ncbi:MAG TPA: radical SAM family heme chaperone HemW [Polyangiaceae bacterium]|nr:radical SAM family heme chaperone HemW [Polyangiaceae bacterium]
MARPELPLLVYVHFPYCLQKCPYCDFVSYATDPGSIDHEGYARAVEGELRARLALLDREPVSPRLYSVFFGGGTPSLWAPEGLERVLAGLNQALGGPAREVTLEANPSSLDEARARAFVRAGVDRVSVGVQALEAERLRFLGRLHSAEQALATLRAALSAGFRRVSGDLLYGVSGQTPEVAAAEAAELARVGVTHLSAYNLTIEANTRFGALARAGRLPLAQDAAMVDSFFAVDRTLRPLGFGHYEISNYAMPGDESQHNLGYWRGLDYLGLGCAAVGTLPHQGARLRYRNHPDPRRYVAAAQNPDEASLTEPGPLLVEAERLDPETRLRERIMLGLRLAEGLDIGRAADELGADPWPPGRRRAAERLVQRGRLAREGDRLFVPFEAWPFADGTAAELF